MRPRKNANTPLRLRNEVSDSAMPFDEEIDISRAKPSQSLPPAPSPTSVAAIPVAPMRPISAWSDDAGEAQGIQKKLITVALGMNTCALCMEDAPIQEDSGHEEGFHEAQGPRQKKLVHLPCCNGFVTVSGKGDVTRELGFPSPSSNPPISICSSCIRSLCTPSTDGLSRIGRCPCCLKWIEFVESKMEPNFDFVEVKVIQRAGNCRSCKQEHENLVDGGSCDACFLGTSCPLRYQCAGCRLEQVIHHPMYRFQKRAATFGHKAWMCHQRCNVETKWRVARDQIRMIPPGDVPGSWGEDYIKLARSRVVDIANLGELSRPATTGSVTDDDSEATGTTVTYGSEATTSCSEEDSDVSSLNSFDDESVGAGSFASETKNEKTGENSWFDVNVKVDFGILTDETAESDDSSGLLETGAEVKGNDNVCEGNVETNTSSPLVSPMNTLPVPIAALAKTNDQPSDMAVTVSLTEGWIFKKGSGKDWFGSTSWKPRWANLALVHLPGFSEDVPMLLLYWHDKLSTTPSMSINLISHKAISGDRNEELDGVCYNFTIFNETGKTQRIFAAPLNEKNEWVKQINGAAREYERKTRQNAL